MSELSENRWRRAGALFLCLFGTMVMAALPAQAHDARPFSITITEQQEGRFSARLRVPPTVAADNRPVLQWPQSCDVLSGRPGAAQLAACEQGLRGEQLSVRYPIYNPSLPTLIRIEEQEGGVITQLLRPDQLEWEVPLQPSLWQVAGDYLRLGVEHIWSGVDHLLFVAGLLLLAGTMRRVLLAVTGFTIAHSVTLSLAALDLVRLPIAPVEAVIALSILFLAREITRPHPGGLAMRHPILVSSSFGLLHGFGFASALQEIGLPAGELATGLLSFNIGVELGQIAFIALAFLVLWLVRRLQKIEDGFSFEPKGRLRLFAGYALGVPAAYWFIERAWLIFA